jgi:hypothetical protein
MAACNAHALVIFMKLFLLSILEFGTATKLGYIALLKEAAPSCLLLVKSLKL